MESDKSSKGSQAGCLGATASVAPPAAGAPATHLRMGKHKLVRASPSLIAQLRERAAEVQPAPAQQAAPRGRVSAPAAQQQQAARRSNTWTRLQQPLQQQQQLSARSASIGGPLLKTSAATIPAPPAKLMSATAQPAIMHTTQARQAQWRPAPQQPNGAASQPQQPRGKPAARPGAAAAVAQPQAAALAAPSAAAAPSQLLPNRRSNTWTRQLVQAATPVLAAGPAPVTAAAAPQKAAAAPSKAAGRASAPQQQTATPTRAGKSTVAVLARSFDGQQQQRVLVYKKGGRKGHSLRRTAVNAAAHGSLTWRNPSAAAAAAGQASALASPAAADTAGCKGGPRGAVTTPQQQRGGSEGKEPASIVHSSSKKWHKYVRAAVAGLAASKARPPAQLPGSSRAGKALTGSGLSGGSRLLRLGSNVYKVASGKGRSRSLQRQSSREPAMLAAGGSPAAAKAGGSSCAAKAAGVAPLQPSPALPAVSAAASGAAAGTGSSMQRLSRFKLASAAAAAALAAARKRRSTAGKASAAPAAGAAPAVLRPRGGVAKSKISTAAPAAAKQRHQRQPSGKGAGTKIVYCPLYCRTGKCERRGKGCPYKHDSTKRTVCPRWLHGCCKLGAKCPLQHQRKAELMPICQHFLLGCCTAEACPYLHVNLPASSPICKRFLRGFCPAGAACPHKHYTLRMVREEKTLAASAAGAQDKAGRRKAGRKRAAAGRYFDASPVEDAATVGEAGLPQRRHLQQQQQEQQQQDAGEKQLGAGRQQQAKRRRQGEPEEGDAAGPGQQGSHNSDALNPSFLVGDYVPL